MIALRFGLGLQQFRTARVECFSAEVVPMGEAGLAIGLARHLSPAACAAETTETK